MASQQVVMSLAERLDKIRSPKLQNQKETAIVLSAVEDTLKDQGHAFTPTAYFAALLALLQQAISASTGIVNKELATSVVYLLDIITSYVPAPLLRSKFSQILTNLAPALTQQDAEAPLLRHSMGCLESLLIAQDTAAWALPQTQVSPRGAVAGILALALDHRPKVRKQAKEALVKVLENPPPSPSLDHPAADLCAEAALHSLKDVAQTTGKKQKGRGSHSEEHHPGIMHSLQLVKTVALASGGWPSKRIDTLCEVLLNISKSSNEYLAMASFDVFETIFAGMAGESSSAKLPRLLEAISELRPSRNDSQLMPPWIAVLSRGYDVSAQISPEETFYKLPDLFSMAAEFLTSMSHNIRISASECLISFVATCIPSNVILDPSVFDEKILEKISKTAIGLLHVKYQAAWMEVFNVLSALFESLKWRSTPLLDEVVKTVGELRSNESFNGKKEAETVLGKAIEAMGPEAVLRILPLNLAQTKQGQPGRAWLLPLLRDNVINANLKHFRTELIPLSEVMFQKAIDNEGSEKTMQTKIYETIVHQVWATLPGYCTLPLDVAESFDQSLAELISNLLYTQTDLRVDLCKALQLLVETNKEIAAIADCEDNLILQKRITKVVAVSNIDHLAKFSGNLLAVLFNVYSQTLPHHRGYILQCINAYLSITPEKELVETFDRVTTMLESSLVEYATKQAEKQNQKQNQVQKQPLNKMPPTTHTLMDLIITLSVYLPRSSYQALFTLAGLILPQTSDPQLQKKAYKLLPRLATSEAGIQALQERNTELQQLLLSSASSVSTPARRDRLVAASVVITHMPPSSLHFIPSILSEVVISTKEVNEKARNASFDLLVQMGKKMSSGGVVAQSKIPHMSADAPDTIGSLEEFFTMVSAGLAGSTPHMISASVTSLTRILYEFRTELPDRVLEDLVSTMDLFLTSKNREIVRSVLGFVKVAILSLPDNIIQPRLESLVSGLVEWSHEHKARFRTKVKHILERTMRRFSYETVERYCPEEDKKFIHNIHKTKERNKRKKENSAGNEAENPKDKQRSKFESEFDEAVYGSDSEESDSDDADDRGHNGVSIKQKGNETYIIEDEDEPLDLLDRKSLGNISTTKPVRFKPIPANGKTSKKAKTDLDGKLLFGEDDDDVEMMEFGEDGEPGDGTLEGGINAYVNAIKGHDAVQRGPGGRLKFSNKKIQEDAMDVDEKDAHTATQETRKKSARGRGEQRGRNPRKGLDGSKTNARGGGGRVAKNFGGSGRGRGRGRERA